jgi:hypothetical protein
MTNFGGFRVPIMQQRLTTVLGRASTEKNDVLPTVETPHKSRAFRSYLLHSLTIWVLLNIIFIHVPRNIGSFEIYQPIQCTENLHWRWAPMLIAHGPKGQELVIPEPWEGQLENVLHFTYFLLTSFETTILRTFSTTQKTPSFFLLFLSFLGPDQRIFMW